MINELSLIQELTVFLLNKAENLFKFDINVRGIKNLPNAPVLFVPNHFTRVETILIPYALRSYCQNKPIRSLADQEFFTGDLAILLKSLGVVSVESKNRDETIINDLVNNYAQWVIYPEGAMIKDKKTVTQEGVFSVKSDYWRGSMRTGAVVLAMKAEMMRLALLKQGEKVSNKPIYLIPVSISYYPLRGYNRSLEKVLRQFDISEELQKEIIFEANMLFNSTININIGKPFNMNQKISFWYNVLQKVPFMPREQKQKFIINTYRNSLTLKVARRIYNNTTLNIEHLFTFCLYESGLTKIRVYKIKYFIIKVTLHFLKTKKDILGEKLTNVEILTLLIPKKYEPFEHIVKLATNLGIICSDGRDFIINRKKLEQKAPFYDALLKTPFSVIYNEILAMTNHLLLFRKILYKTLHSSHSNFTQDVLHFDQKIYGEKFKEYYNKELSIKYEYGCPNFLKSKSKKIGVVLAHGYLASPGEVQSIARILNHKYDIAVYSVRLAGHGTSPQNIKDVSWKDWLNSYWNGVAALLNEYESVFLGGFSSGGLLSLLCSSELNFRLKGVFSINPPITLHDIRSRFVPAINIWNDILDSVNLKNLKYEYIENFPQYPSTNYKYNYLLGIEQLGKLINVTKRKLSKIVLPALIINSKNDSIVDSKSSKYIYDKMLSQNKQLCIIDTDNHIIVRGKYQDEVVGYIIDFIQRQG